MNTTSLFIGFLLSTFSQASFSELTTSECEAFLRGPEGSTLIQEVREWWTQTPSLRTKLKDGTNLNNIDQIDVLMSTEENEQRSNQELNQMLAQRLSGLRLGFEVPRIRNVEPTGLTNLQKAALGIPVDLKIDKSDVAYVIFKNDEVITLDRRNNRLGHFHLNLDEIHIGFANKVVLWRAKRDPAMAHHDRVNDSALPRFLMDHGQVLFVREFNGIRFGYMSGLNAIEQEPNAVEYLSLEAFLVRDCQKHADSKADVIFPKPGRDERCLNFRLTPLDLAFERHP